MARVLPFLVLAALAVAGHPAPGFAQDKSSNEPSRQEKLGPPLQVGDPAPPLKASCWLQGDPVAKFEPGKVYVVEFWAPWCGAPIRYMPHLGLLQTQYKDQGVTVISFTARDIRDVRGNTEEQVRAWVKKRGPALPHTFAYADNRAAADAWLKGQPHFLTFVVDRAGRLAYIGSPMAVALALPKVLARGATAKAVGAEMAQEVAEYRAVCAAMNEDPQTGLLALKKYEANYPALADFMPVVYHKLGWLLQHGKLGEAKDYAETLVTKAAKQNNVFLLELVSMQLRQHKESKELLALAVQAAQAKVQIEDGRDAQSLLHLADAYLLHGDKTRAKECARKAIAAAAADSAADRQEIEKEAWRFGSEK
jgi:thiol-disulfide isomerase/thioredoxin